MSFYDSAPLGRILSRVSSDLSIVDLDIPFSLVFACGATINAYSNLRVLAAVTWQVLFVSIPMVFLAIQLQKYYFSTAKELIRINGTTKSFNNSIMLEKKADEKVILLSEEHKREKNELFRTIIELEKQLDVKTALALEIERIRGALLLIKQMHEDGDLQGRNKMNKIEELLKKKEEDLTMVELIVKDWISNDEIQEAQKELIIGLWDSSNQAFIHVKRVGVDINPFQTATSRNFFKEANIELLELWSLWADYTRDESWHPFKVIVDKVGNAKRFIIQ